MFAGSVMLGSLDDFISPAQACVNPLFTGPATSGSENALQPKGSGQTSTDTAAGSGKIASGAAKVSIVSDFGLLSETSNVRPDLIKSINVGAGASGDANGANSRTARVTLNDCLACSGCVTSAETVLIQQQSGSELRAAVQRPATAAVLVTFAPQALASLAAHLGLTTVVETYERLTTFFKWQIEDWRAEGAGSLLPVFVIDTQVALDLVLHGAGEEFLLRAASAAAQEEQAASLQVSGLAADVPVSGSTWVTPAPTLAVSASRQMRIETDGSMNEDIGGGEGGGLETGGSGSSALLPVLTSSCPGWVCFAEKSVPEALPFVSSLKSPQQVTGALAKYLLARGGVAYPLPRVGGTHVHPPRGEVHCALPALAPSTVYHVTIMPCYDKKLEASRRDFWWEKDGILGAAAGCTTGPDHDEAWTAGWHEVDCVLSSGEVAELIDSHALAQTQKHSDRAMAFLYPPSPRTNFLFGGSTPAAFTPAPTHSGPLDLETLLCSVIRTPSDSCSASASEDASLAGASAVHIESDGYLAYVYRHAEAVLGHFALAGGGTQALTRQTGPLPLMSGRSGDMREARLTVPVQALLRFARHARGEGGGEGDQGLKLGQGSCVTLTFAAAYGFRSIQAVVSRMKRAKGRGPLAGVLSKPNLVQTGVGGSGTAYAYVEIMACPGGCTSGGGQVRTSPAGGEGVGDNQVRTANDAAKARVGEVSRLHSSRSAPRCSEPHLTVSRLRSAVPDLARQGGLWGALTGTRYHAVAPLILAPGGGMTGSALKW